VRSRSFTGKPCRLLKNDWTDAWDAPGNPKPLGMPLQMMVAIDCVSRGHAFPEEARERELQPGRAGDRAGNGRSGERRTSCSAWSRSTSTRWSGLQTRERGRDGLTASKADVAR